jgi:hypothetical protein
VRVEAEGSPVDGRRLLSSVLDDGGDGGVLTGGLDESDGAKDVVERGVVGRSEGIDVGADVSAVREREEEKWGFQ